MAISDMNARGMITKSAHGPTAEDKARREAIESIRRQASEPRGPSDKVMIVNRSGMTRDIKTGRPPTMKAEARDAWLRAREDMSIEKLFR
jgi:hypothetical protein